VLERVRRLAARVRGLHQGNLQEYVLYVLAAIVVLLLLDAQLGDWLRQLAWSKGSP
jgi:hypothetical protein